MSTENIRVVMRFRPLNKREEKLSSQEDDFQLNIDTSNNVVDINSHRFIFDNVFDKDAEQKNLFEASAKHAVEWVSEGYNATIFAYGPTGCLDPNTKVRMYDGTLKKAKDIAIGDVLMGDDSTPRNVSQLFYGEDDMYDIIPAKGDTYRVNKGHVLTLKHIAEPTVVWCEKDFTYKVRWFEDGKNHTKTFAVHGENKKSPRGNLINKTKEEAEQRACNFCETLKNKDKTIDIKLTDYLEQSRSKKRLQKGIRTGVEYPEKDLGLDPYILGLWLGDGCSHSPSITTVDTEIIGVLESFAKKIGCKVVKHNDFSYRISSVEWHNNLFWTFLKDNNLFNNKHIPYNFLVNSRENRLKLLAGILDSDGHLDAKTKTVYDIVQKNERLFDDILTLCRSLGFSAYKEKCIKTCTNAPGGPKEGTYFRCNISGRGLTEIPVLLPKKKAEGRKQIKDVLSTGIKVQYVGKGPYNGFLVDGNHRFLLEDFTITHNTGKTYTMFGGKGKDRGIIPRACELLFQLINESDDVMEANVKCSFLEIYRENLRDLLIEKKRKIASSEYVPSRRLYPEKQHTFSTPKERSRNLNNPEKQTMRMRIRQNFKKGVYVQGAIEKFVYTADDILDTIKKGAEQRSTASTALNHTSSRSHAVLTLTVTQNLVDGSEIVSKLHMIDLAGSENVEKSEAQGVTLKEAQMINKSLSSLGNVIYALTEKGRGHIPYRDSRLTYLLQDSLGGNSKTILISTATPHSSVYSETLNTLKFAQRTKSIKNIPKVNKNESNANLIKTVAMLTKKLAEMTIKYEDSKAVIEKVEKVVEVNDSRQVALLESRCERLEKRIKQMQDLKTKDEQRYEQLKEIFNKQRELAQLAAETLYHERIKVCSMQGELEQYKLLYDSLKDALKTPSVLEMMVKNATIGRSSLSIDTDLHQPIAVEVDSPV